MLFFLLINVKMPTIVGILTFMSRKNNFNKKNNFIASGPENPTKLSNVGADKAIPMHHILVFADEEST